MLIMEKEAPKILKQLISKFDFNEELLAYKFQVTTRTIQRWIQGNNNPSYAELKYLRQIYNGCKSRKIKQ